MPDFPPDQLALWTEGRWTKLPAAPIGGFVTDTRELRPGRMFVALKTEKRDGHQFLGAALEAGAAAALVAAPDAGSPLPQLVVADPLTAFQAIARAHRRQFRGPVIGVTGSAGKTSTKEMLAVLLGGERVEGTAKRESSFAEASADKSPVLATEGNLNNGLGVPLTLTRLDPAIHRYAVIEAGISAPGEMAPLAAMIAPDLAVVTLVAPAHLLELGDIEGVAREKAVLAAAVRPGGAALFPPQCAEFAAFRGLKVTTVVAGCQVVPRGDATEIVLSPALRFLMRRVSDGMARNAALALTAALRLGFPAEVLQERIGRWAPSPLRGEVRRDGGRLLYIDCYNANPASMTDALAAFSALAPAGPPRLFVVGCMEELGSDAVRLHREVGRGVRLGPEDFIFIIGANAAALREGVLEAGVPAAQIATPDSLEPVAARLAGFRGAVFVKGSRRYQLERLLN